MNTNSAALPTPPPAPPSLLTLYDHQLRTVDLLRREPFVFDMSDPGTGKTLPSLTVFAERRAAGHGPALIFAPKSILDPTWGDHIRRFFPGLTYVIASATNRKKAFELDVDVYITNHDAAAWLAKNWARYKPKFAAGTLLVDESTAYKNPNAIRSKAIATVAIDFAFREVMSGTPNPNTILELWHQMKICDGGQRLGNSYWKFRAVVCEPRQAGPSPDMLEWVDRDGAQEAVSDLLSDCTIRHKFEDCITIPPNVQRTVRFDLTPEAMRAYRQMKTEALIELQGGGKIEAIHAAALTTKLLQIAAGAVYTDRLGNYHVIDQQRTELIMDLVEQRSHSLVAFQWQHQRDLLVAEAEKRGIKYAVLDGSIKQNDRTEAVANFQAGDLQVIFAHPRTAGHGLTLTRGVATIWASPTYASEAYKQFFHRIYRNGQTKQTETIHILANHTIDEVVYEKLDSKLTAMQLLLSLVEQEPDAPKPPPAP